MSNVRFWSLLGNFTSWTLLHFHAFTRSETTLQRRWWRQCLLNLGIGRIEPHYAGQKKLISYEVGLIPDEGRLIWGWCHHHTKSLLKMTRNEGCLLWGWGHTRWGRAHTWWGLSHLLWCCAHTLVRLGSSLREWGGAHQGKGSHSSRCLAKGLHSFHEGCPKVSVCVIPQLGSDCLNITNVPQWFYKSKTFLTALCWQSNCNS